MTNIDMTLTCENQKRQQLEIKVQLLAIAVRDTIHLADILQTDNWNEGDKKHYTASRDEALRLIDEMTP